MKKQKNLLFISCHCCDYVGAFLFAPKGVEYVVRMMLQKMRFLLSRKIIEPWFSPLFEPPRIRS